MQEYESVPGSSGEVSGQAAGVGSSYLPWLDTVAPRRGTGTGLGWGGESAERGPAWAAVYREDLGLAALLHDTRNMVTAMELYCDLLEEPGVLAEPYQRYAGELRLVAAASRRLLERLSRAGQTFGGNIPAGRIPAGIALSDAGAAAAPASGEAALALATDAAHGVADGSVPGAAAGSLERPGRMEAFAAGEPIVSLADDLRANQNLLAAVAGHGVTVGVEVHSGDRGLEMTREDLTRVLVNLTKNAAEAMHEGGHLQIDLEEHGESLRLTFSDSGPGIPEEEVEAIFAPGYTTHLNREGCGETPAPVGMWPVQHRGLGLAIVRSIVAAAGGSTWAANRGDGQGAVLTLEFPSRCRIGGEAHGHALKA